MKFQCSLLGAQAQTGCRIREEFVGGLVVVVVAKVIYSGRFVTRRRE